MEEKTGSQNRKFPFMQGMSKQEKLLPTFPHGSSINEAGSSLLTVKPPREAQQDRMFELLPEKSLELVGERRARFGQISERVVEGLIPDYVPIGGGGIYDVVYDGSWDNHFVEVKNVRRGSSIPLYISRMEKDAQVERQGHKVVYVITIHNCKSPDTLSKAWTQMSKTVKEVLLVPSSIIRELCVGKRLHKVVTRKPDSRIGYEREGYCRGYQLLKVSEIKELDFLARPYHYRSTINGLPFSVKLFKSSSLKRSLTK